MFIQADYQQLVHEVKERNRFYKTLLEIQTIATEASLSQDLDKCKRQLQTILEKCEKTLDDAM